MAQNKEFKLPEKTRNYHRDKKRIERLATRKCKICNEQAWGKILLTQELRCAKHLVFPLKDELLRQQK